MTNISEQIANLPPEKRALLLKKLAQTSQPATQLSNSTVALIQPKGTKKPLFLVPASGKTAANFVYLSRHLGLEQPVYGLDYLGMDGQCEPHTTIPEIAAYNIQQIQNIQPSGPYYLGGMCTGGIVAYEMARQLQAQGQEVALLMMLDVISPPRLRKRTVGYYLAEALAQLHGFWLDGKLLSPIKRQIFIWNDVLKVNKKLSENPEFVGHVYRVHTKARKQYITKVYPGKILLVQGLTQSQIMQERQIKKWEEVTAGGLEIARVDVPHDYIIHEPGVKLLAAILKGKLEQN